MSDLASLKIGQIIMGDQSRDAIHMAIAPVVASHRLYPGQPIALGNEGFAYGPPAAPIGIVDPFLTKPVQEGQKFWMFLNPGSITSLRHDWTHPAFTVEEAHSLIPAFDGLKQESEKWLRKYASALSPYDNPEEAFVRLIDGFKNQEIFANGSDLHGLYELDQSDELKHHAEIFLGRKIDYSEFSFSCSC